MEICLTFLGAARTVTGSRFLLECESHRFLVDCGLFQGLKELRLRNWEPLPESMVGAQALILTHAHLDHVGALPLLARQGFQGPVYTSIPTRDLARLILMDAAHIQEEDAEAANLGGYSKHHPARALFNSEDAERALQLVRPVDTDRWQDLGEGFRFRLRPSGHILGSTFVEFDCRGTRIVFSGDLGRREPLVLKPRVAIERADYLILESTYGDREHGAETPLHELERIACETLQRGGTLIIPSFSVGRAQDLLYLFHQLRQQNRIPKTPIYLDSPMACDVTRLYTQYQSWHRLPERGIKSLSEDAILVPDYAQSQSLLRGKHPKVVIAGAGMITGGRVLGHLKKHLPYPEDTVLLVGFQAAGTRGRQLRDGATEVKIQGEWVPVKAQVREMVSLSAHADRSETLDWLRGFTQPPQTTFIVHGESLASDALSASIQEKLGWKCLVPELEQTVILPGKH